MLIFSSLLLFSLDDGTSVVGIGEVSTIVLL